MTRSQRAFLALKSVNEQDAAYAKDWWRKTSPEVKATLWRGLRDMAFFQENMKACLQSKMAAAGFVTMN